MLKDRIAEQLNEWFAGTDLFLVDIKVTPQDKVMVFVDGRNNITIDQCVEISRKLEAFLETENLVREDYTLEVSSPGMDQPFKVPAQYEKSVGRPVEVLKKDGIKFEGVLVRATGESVVLRVEKKNKGKTIASEEVEVPMDDIKTTKQLITFK